MLQINQFKDHDRRIVTAVGTAAFQNELTDGRETLYFYQSQGRLQDGTEVEIIFYTDCQMDADDHAHKAVDSDENDGWYITPVGLVHGLQDGTYMLAHVGLYGVQTERAKEAERVKREAEAGYYGEETTPF